MSAGLRVSGIPRDFSNYKKKMIVSGFVTLAALVGGIVLACFAHANHSQVSNLKNELDSSPNPNDIQSQIDHVSHLYALHLGFSITLFVVSVIGAGITRRQMHAKAKSELSHSLQLELRTALHDVQNEIEPRAPLYGVHNNKMTPLTGLVHQNDTFAVARLLTSAEEVNTPNGYGHTPLTIAVMKGNLGMVLLLVGQLGANINASDGRGDSALTLAAWGGDSEMVGLLAELGADIDAQDGKGDTALTLAVRKGDLAMVKLLGELGASPNHNNRNGSSPLTIALVKGEVEIFRYLVKELKADLYLSSNTGLLPLEIATMLQDTTRRKLVEEASPDLNLWNECWNRKELANIWGIPGNSVISRNNGKLIEFIRLGMIGRAPKVMLNNFLPDFIKNCDAFAIAEKNELLEAAEEAIDTTNVHMRDESIVQKIKSGRPVIIFSGSDDHTMAYVIAGNRLYVCNRGNGRDKKYAIRTFALDPPQQNAHLIHQLRTVCDSMEQLNQMLAGLNLRLLEDESIKMKDQKVGNCNWSSAAKGCVMALFQHYKKEKGLYKQFSAYARKQALGGYLANSDQFDIPLLKAVGTKLKDKMRQGKSPYDTDLFDYQLLKKLSEVTGEDYSEALQNG